MSCRRIAAAKVSDVIFHSVINNILYYNRNCLSILSQSDDDSFVEAVAEWQMYFGGLKRDEQYRIVVEMIRNGSFLSSKMKKGIVYRIPFILSNEHETFYYDPLRSAVICANAFLDLVGWSRYRWTTCKEHAATNTMPGHKLKGRQSVRRQQWNNQFKEDMIDHMETLRKYAEPVATRFVRETTGEITTRDDDDDNEYLGPNWTKRDCFKKFCASRGVRIEYTSTGSVKKTAIEGFDGEILPVPSWSAYHSFWLTNYPNLKVTPLLCS